MDRRDFLKTSGVAAGAATVGFGVAAKQASDAAAAQSLPDEGVELVTNEYNVTHVYGSDLYDVGYGQGYAQARDRLFQIDIFRLVGRGESAKLIGPSQLGSDLSVKRELYNDEELQEQWEGATDETREAIRGYTDGVNDRMDEMKARGELPGEFTLLGRSPPEWKPTDSIAVISFLIGRFGVGGGSELGNAETINAMFDHVAGVDADLPDAFESEEAAWEAYHDLNKMVVTERHYGSISDETVADTEARAYEYDEVPDGQWDAIEAAANTEDWGTEESSGLNTLSTVPETGGLLGDLSWGSNAMVVDGEHTETGDAMLAGGPQMGLLKPPVIHEIGLHGPEFDVVGVGVVGAPGIVVGRTKDFAWTVTTAGDDAIDTIAVELDPDDRYRYRWDGEWHELVTEEYTHEPNAWGGIVEGNMSPERVEQEVAYVEQEGTRMPVVGWNPDENVAFVRRVSTRMDELDGAFMWADVGRATSREEFEESLSEFPFGFNFHYVDGDSIGYYRTAKTPQRDHAGDPRFPIPAEHHSWDGFDVGLDIGANEVDPDRGFVVNWNNAPAPGWRNGDGEFAWEGAQRVEVMDRLVKEKILRTDEDLSIDDFDGIELAESASGNLALADVAEIIADCSVEHPFAPGVIPHFVAAARASDEDRLNAMADELERWAGAENREDFTEFGTIERWFATEYPYRPGDDGRYPTGGMAIYEELGHALTDLLFEDTLGNAAPELDFDGAGGTSPHAAAHGSTNGGHTSFLVDVLEGRAEFDWLAEYGEVFELTNVATGESLNLDKASGLWGWLFDEDEIRRTDPADNPTRWLAQGVETGRRGPDVGEPCELQAMEDSRGVTLDGSSHAVTLDGSGQGASLEPSTERAEAFEFSQNDDGTYLVRTEDGLALQPDDGDGVCQQPVDGSQAQKWAVSQTAPEEERTAILQTVMHAAADALEEKFGSADPSEWRLDVRTAGFRSLGGAQGEEIAITNRASFQQLIGIGLGEGSERDHAESVLPPSNTGHIDTWDLVATQLGNEPGRLTDQLGLYTSFEYKPHPITREAVDELAVDTRDYS